MRLDVNGVGLEVDDQRPDSDTRTPVLLVHGWPDTHAMWRDQIAALNGAGYRTIAPDLRGFGASDKPDGDTLTCTASGVCPCVAESFSQVPPGGLVTVVET